MTYEGFLDELRHLRRRWWFSYMGDFAGRETSAVIVSGPKRPYGPYTHPIAAVVTKASGQVVDNYEWKKAAEILNLDALTAKQIADATWDFSHSILRRRKYDGICSRPAACGSQTIESTRREDRAAKRPRTKSRLGAVFLLPLLAVILPPLSVSPLSRALFSKGAAGSKLSFPQANPRGRSRGSTVRLGRGLSEYRPTRCLRGF